MYIPVSTTRRLFLIELVLLVKSRGIVKKVHHFGTMEELNDFH